MAVYLLFWSSAVLRMRPLWPLQHVSNQRPIGARSGYVMRRQPSWGVTDPSCRFKLVYASDDGGQSWRHVGSPGPMQWPQVFSCASGAAQMG